MLSEIAPGIHRTEKVHLTLAFGILSTLAAGSSFVSWKAHSKHPAGASTSAGLGTLALFATCLSLVPLFSMPYMCSGAPNTSPMEHAPAREKISYAAKLGSMLKEEIIFKHHGFGNTQDVDRAIVRNGAIATLAQAALSLEERIARNERIRIALVAVATVAIAAISAAVLYKLVESISNKVSRRTYALGTAATAGVLGLLQTSPLLSPIVSSKLKYWQSEYRKELKKVSAAA